MVSRLQPGLDCQELLLERPACVRRDFSPRLPAYLAMGLDGLGGEDGVAGKVVCTENKKQHKSEHKSGIKGQAGSEEGGLPSIRSSIRLKPSLSACFASAQPAASVSNSALRASSLSCAFFRAALWLSSWSANFLTRRSRSRTKALYSASLARRAAWAPLSCSLKSALAPASMKTKEKLIRGSRQGRSDPAAQQSARISGTTPSGCADAPPQEMNETNTHSGCWSGPQFSGPAPEPGS